MPQNLDEQTRTIIFRATCVAVTVLASANLFTQWVVIPGLRRNPKNKPKAPPLLGLGCLASILLMMAVSALATWPLLSRSNNPEATSAVLVEPHSPTSSINFCEPDFVNHPWIAEPSNVMSSLASYCPLAYLGLFGRPSREWKTRVSGHVRFGVCYTTLLSIGLGSTLLHCLLTAQAQGADELPMLWFLASLSFCVLDLILKDHSSKSNHWRWWHWLVVGLALAATSLYVGARHHFLPFAIMFSSFAFFAIGGIIWIGLLMNWKDDAFRANVLLPLAVCTGWVAIFAVGSWISEMLWCQPGSFFFERCIHAFWHCGTALLAWLLTQLLLAGQGFQKGWGEPQLRWYIAPYVTFYPPAPLATSTSMRRVKQT